MFIGLLFRQVEALAAPVWGYPTSNFVISSPFGWRIHPIFGTSRFHSGLDFAAPEGTAVVAVDSGIVITAGRAGGYGNFIQIKHDDGLVTCYAHNRSLCVSVGTRVTAGTLIAYVGSTGYSTGPHLHFEVLKNGLFQDPAAYLDPNLPMPTNSAIGILPDGSTNFLDSDTYDMSWDMNYYVNFGNKSKEFVDQIVDACVAGLTLLQGPIKSLFIILITIDLALAASFNLFKDQENIVEWMFKRLLKYGFLLWVITDWKTFVLDQCLGYFATSGGLMGGADAITAGQLMSDTTTMMQKGAYLAGPAFAHASNIHGIAVMKSPGDLLISLLLGFFIVFCFIFMGLEIMIVYVEFYVIGTMSLVMFVFSGLKQTAKYADNSWKGVVQVSIKVMLYCFFSVMMNTIAQSTSQLEYDPVLYLKMLAACLAVLFMSIRMSKIISRVF